MGTRPLVNESLAEYHRGVVDYLSRLEAAQFLVTAMRREERMIVRHLIPFHKSYLSDLPYPSYPVRLVLSVRLVRPQAILVCSPTLGRFLNDPDLFFRQAVEFVYQGIDLPVGGIYLALDSGLLVRRLRLRQLLVQCEH